MIKSLYWVDVPRFSDAEKAALKGSADFLGLNFYTSKWVPSLPVPQLAGTPLPG
jgi:hypothetical protein